MIQYSPEDVSQTIKKAARGDVESHRALWQWTEATAAKEFAEYILDEVLEIDLDIVGCDYKDDCDDPVVPLQKIVLAVLFSSAFAEWSVNGKFSFIRRADREAKRKLWFEQFELALPGFAEEYVKVIKRLPPLASQQKILMPGSPDAIYYAQDLVNKHVEQVNAFIEVSYFAKYVSHVQETIERLIRDNLAAFDRLMDVWSKVYAYKKDHPEHLQTIVAEPSDIQLYQWARKVVKERKALSTERSPVQKFITGDVKNILWPLDTQAESVVSYYMTRYAASIIGEHITDGIHNWYPFLRDIFKTENEVVKNHSPLVVAVDVRGNEKKCYSYDFNNFDFLTPFASSEVDWTFGISRESAKRIAENIEGIYGWKNHHDVYFLAEGLVRNMPPSAIDNVVRMVKDGQIDDALSILEQRVPVYAAKWFLKDLAFVVMTPYLTDFETEFLAWNRKTLRFDKMCNWIDGCSSMWYSNALESDDEVQPYSLPEAVAFALMIRATDRYTEDK